MEIAIWWEQDDWGGVDSHMLSLLSNWPIEDKITLFVNANNPGWKRVGPLLPHAKFLNVIEIKRKKVLGSFAMRLFDYSFLPFNMWRISNQAKRVLRKHGPFDAFLGENGGYPASWPTLAAMRGAYRSGIRTRVLLVQHQAAPRLPFRQTIELLIDRSMSKFCTSVIATSGATRNSLIGIRQFDVKKLPIRIIYNGINLDVDETAFDLRTQFGINPESFLIGILGRLEPYKGHDELVRAVSMLPSAIRQRVTICIIGGSDSVRKNEIMTLASNLGIGGQILFTGYINHKPQEIISSLNLLIQATQQFESPGLTILEAMAVGTPILATNVGAVPECFDTSVGVIAQPGSIMELSVGIQFAMENTGEILVRAGASKLRVIQFDEKVMAREIRNELTNSVQK
jgi:glycosyltransferase involved in cell wall biosynthesis